MVAWNEVMRLLIATGDFWCQKSNALYLFVVVRYLTDIRGAIGIGFISHRLYVV